MSAPHNAWRVTLAAAAITATGLLTAAPAVATTTSPAVPAQTATQAAEYRYENWYFTYARCHQAGREGKDLGRWTDWKCVADSVNFTVELWVK